MVRYQSEYEAFQRRERRRERLWRVAGCLVMAASAVGSALLLYVALVGFLVLLGGK